MQRKAEVEDLGVCSELRLQGQGACRGRCSSSEGCPLGHQIATGAGWEEETPPPLPGFRVLEEAFPGWLPAPGF